MKEGEARKVYKLKRALYGLKQDPRSWNARINDYFIKNGFSKCPYEHALYMKTNNNGEILLICLYMNNLIFIGNSLSMIKEFKASMVKEFEMIDIELMAHF